MRRLLTILSLVAMVLTLVLLTPSAKAYESDTHFDMMYHLSRAAGLSDGMAKFFALGNQHIDEGIISSPMLLTVQRQLFHFPGDLEKIEIEGHGAISLPSRIFKSKLALAERNSAIGNYLIYLGMTKGDLTLVALGMHIKMDTYGHAGHSNLLGHMEAGHNPDRAFLERKKYEDMIRSIMQSLVSVKQLLPKESKDEESALKYLNKFAKESHLGRDLTVNDMQNATTISGMVFKDMTLQSVYREDMFRKYEYKKLALEKIYKKFVNSGEINSEVSFGELFPEDLIRDPRLSTKDVVKYVITSTTDAEFLKAEGGKEIFNLQKLFKYNDVNIFNRKFSLEVGRSEFRLRELFHEIAELEKVTEKYGVDLNNWEKQIADFHEQNSELKAKNEKLKFTDPVEFISAKYSLSVTEVRSIFYRNQRVQDEKEELLKGVGPSSNFEEGSEEFIKARAPELAENRNAEEIAIKLTKDLIPSERTEYIKQNFEGETENRSFEKDYKLTAHRLLRVKNWGVNFVHGQTGPNLVGTFKSAALKFKNLILRRSTVESIQEWKKLAQEAAAKYMQMDTKEAMQDLAEVIGFGAAVKRDAFTKLVAYVGPAITPWIFGKMTGFRYIQGIIKKAKAHAKDHEVEDMELAVAEGKYKADFLSEKRSKQAFEFARGNNRTAAVGATLRCEAFFN